MARRRNIFDRTRTGEDLGLDRGGQTGRQRTINLDGSYNIEHRTGRLFGNFYPYHWFITTSWSHYWLLVFGFYGTMNLLFACIYYALGVDQINGIHAHGPGDDFLYCFFFSAQSFTTVGYGGMYPIGKMANLISTIEAFTGLMTFALATGTLYGRFSRPFSKIKYSPNILIAPYKDITGMQFMVANEMVSALVEMEVRVNVSWFEDEENGKKIRRFQQVKLEYDKIAMFPTSWVINHPIDEESALYGRTLEDIKAMDFEVFILLKGFDDVFSQTIYSRHSYIEDQFVFGAKFVKPFEVNAQGKVVMDITRVGEYESAEISVQQFAG